MGADGLAAGDEGAGAEPPGAEPAGADETVGKAGLDCAGADAAGTVACAVHLEHGMVEVIVTRAVDTLGLVRMLVTVPEVTVCPAGQVVTEVDTITVTVLCGTGTTGDETTGETAVEEPGAGAELPAAEAGADGAGADETGAEGVAGTVGHRVMLLGTLVMIPGF